MNVIKLENLHMADDSWGGKYLQYDLTIDGSKFVGYVDLITFFYDKHSNYILSKRHRPIIKSSDQWEREWDNKHYSGEKSWDYLDSCSCGHAGCAGIWNGVKIKRRKFTTEYRAKKEDGYENGIMGTGKLFLKFSNKSIDDIRKTLVKFANQLDETKPVNSVLLKAMTGYNYEE